MGFILIADINYSLYLLRNCQYFAKQIHLFEKFLQRVLKNFFLQRSSTNFSRRLAFPFTSHLSKIAILFSQQCCQLQLHTFIWGSPLRWCFRTLRSYMEFSDILHTHTHTCSVLFLLIRILFSLIILLVYFH